MNEQKKPELLVTPKDLDAISVLSEAGADAFIIGEQRYGLRLAGEFTREQVKEATEIAHTLGKKIYVAMNALFHNDKIDELADYVRFLAETKVDAIVFGDPAVLMTVRSEAPQMKLHWNPETTATNWFTANYWGRKGAKRAVLARELSMDEIIEMKEEADVELEVQVHGATCMFQSKRTLIGNYMSFQGNNLAVERTDQHRGLMLADPERGVKYPIFEDENGTHILSPHDICIIDELEEMIEAKVDSFKIDGILKSTDYLVKITQLYREAIDLCVSKQSEYGKKKEEWLQLIEQIQPENRTIDTGFFFKETVY
ncbi:peptidase U32 [Alkalihalobacillus alcalophilus ATCC 27647 = CGMCC 1.3604]|uniref:Peptidase U32 n=1 Tax=Alkalihalobacillus alcalophilus ATCC 27647 = CGMCC 1.3604 TaxID=1218173 RepID=A0A094WPQ3_ALKAL|nr:peptidase U32 family protein [Alkalihalobacillus alcalophilus]KGA98013.1 peptidase U32 [Alkalihalobacillus alcalophilus ATCC 27647 = CGMCC 1.3604]MED1561864.1 U32 family peptidase [Alkalihalobacillus alcalophilus]THG90362.1 peptidase U32 [Alkalihalobacillus alcalophilus ATCC 27647 = CGMCC 1.3604]